MKRLLLSIAVLMVAAVPALAQETYPKAEIFGGYSYLNAVVVERESLHGWGASFAGNLGPRVGLVAEFSGHYGKVRTASVELDSSAYTFLFGPRFSARTRSLTAFGHALVGGATVRIEGASDTGLAVGLGGGLDVVGNKNFGLRIIQVDYLPIRLGGEWNHNIRLQTGVIIKLGGSE
ncbi:MAG TPA: hypothetical protein VJH03_15260 [Blastocatellia bacterium]|nr:hypothetical protein [Blastocatellia bacterium]